MSKSLNDWVTIHFKEDSIPGLRSGELTAESKAQIKALFLEIVDRVEKVNESNGRYNACIELRKEIEKL